MENKKDVGQASDSGTKTKPKSRDVGEKELIVHGEEEPDTKRIPKSDKEEWSLLQKCKGTGETNEFATKGRK